MTYNPPASIPLSFTTWGEGKVFEWLSSLSGEDRMIKGLQIRKDTRGSVPHRFVVLHMQSGKVHRFDRRLELNTAEEPTKDECVPNLDPDDIEHHTTNEIELLDLQVDLQVEVVVAICFEIAQDPKSHQYSLLTHNCFFSWTIFMAVARRCLPYTKLRSDQSFVKQHIVPMRDFIVKEALDFVWSMAIQTVTKFLSEAKQRPLITAGIPLLQLACNFPEWTLPPAFRVGFEMSVKPGLKRNLENYVKEVLCTRIIELVEHVLDQSETRSLLEGELWLTDLDKILKPAVEREFIKMLWKGLSECITCGLEDNVGQDLTAGWTAGLNASLAAGLAASLTARFAAGLAAEKPDRESDQSLKEYFAVIEAGLRGGLLAICSTEPEAEKDEEVRQGMAQVQERYRGGSEGRQEALQSYNRKMFELVWKAAGNEGLSSAKAKVEEIYNKENKESREWYDKQGKTLWDEIWVVWGNCWGGGFPGTEKDAVEKLAEVIDHVRDSTVKTIVKELLQNATVSASTSKNPPRSGDKPGVSQSMTNEQLQKFMHKTMKDAKGLKQEDLNDTMARIWSKAHERIAAEVGGKSGLGATSE